MLNQTDSLDYRAYHSKNDLDREMCGPEFPKDDPADLVLDQFAAMRDQLVRGAAELSRGAGGVHAAQAFVDEVQHIVRRSVAAGVAEWMDQEGNPTTFRGDEAVIALLNLITGTMVGDGGQVKMTSRQVALHAWVIMFLLEKTTKTLTDIADEGGYTRANASAVAKRYQKKLGLRKCRGMKSDAACQIYSERAKLAHAKRKKQTNQTQCKQTNSNSFNRLSTLRPALTPTLAPAS